MEPDVEPALDDDSAPADGVLDDVVACAAVAVLASACGAVLCRGVGAGVGAGVCGAGVRWRGGLRRRAGRNVGDRSRVTVFAIRGRLHDGNGDRAGGRAAARRSRQRGNQGWRPWEYRAGQS